MSPLKTSVIAAGIACLATVGGLFFVHRGRAQEAQRLDSQNNRMRLEAQQRDEARISAATRASVKPSPAASERTTHAEAAAAPGPASRAYYRNEGNATPLATLQTFAWAGDRGDTALVGRLLEIDPGARSKAEAFVAGLPERTRAQWATVDDMAATFVTMEIMSRPFPSADILATATPEPVSADRVRLRMPSVPRDGSEFVRTSDGWKYVLTEALVDRYLYQARPPQAPAVR